MRATIVRMTNFAIKIQSDNVCPWCYLGKMRLEKGIAQYKAKHPESKDTFTVEWLPYYLNPDLKGKPSMDKQAYYVQKFGSQSNIDAMVKRMTGMFAEEGVEFKLGGRIGSTRDSHRLVQLAKTQGPDAQDKLISHLFKAYFENNEDIVDKAVLKRIAAESGLDEAAVQKCLDSDEYGELVDKEAAEARSNGVSGVPHFNISDTFEFSGAQDPVAFTQLFEKYKTMAPQL